MLSVQVKELKTRSRAVTRKPRDVAAVLFGFPTTFTTGLRVAKLRKPSYRAPNILAKNRI